MTAGAREHFEAGRLDEAVQAQLATVRAKPTDTGERYLLAELLCFAGDLDRADRQLDLMVDQDTGLSIGVALFRQLIRAAQARQQFFEEGRLPEFLADPPELVKQHLQASIALREGDRPEAARLLAEAEAARPQTAGVCDGAPFDDLRDLDDLIAPVFEVLTSTGKYYWVPIGTVVSLEFHKPRRPRDLLWRQARMIVRDGPDGEVYVPAIYAATPSDADAGLRLGRSTEWVGGGDAPVLGHGLRSFLVGDSDRSIMQIGSCTIGPQA